MEPVPGESNAKKEMIEKGIAEMLQLKEQVALKRRQLKALGINDEPELKSKLIKYPDLQAKYKQAKQAKTAAPVPEASTVKPVAAQVPANSPFIDPNAPKSKPIPVPVQVQVQAPEPVQVQVQVQAPVPAAPAPVQAPVPAPARPMRISHDGRFF
jgi:DNA-binding protein H-NS